MLRLKRLRLHNFFLFEDIDVDFSMLKPGQLVFVEGINNDNSDALSNYSGKSTLIVDSFRWILRNKYKRLRKVTDVIGAFDKWTSGTLTYDIDGIEFEISRYRKHPEHANKMIITWGGAKQKDERIIESEKAFAAVMGIDVSRFMYGVLFEASSDTDLFRMDPSPRNKMLGHMWDLDEFDEAAKVARKFASGLDKKLAAAVAAVKHQKELMVEIRRSLKYVQSQERSFKSNKKKELRELKDRISVHKQTGVDNIKSMSEKIASLSEIIALNDVRIAELDKLHILIDSEAAKIAKCQRRYAVGLSKLRDRQNELNKQIKQRKAWSQLASGQERCSECGTQLDATLLERRDVEHRLNEKKLRSIVVKIKRKLKQIKMGKLKSGRRIESLRSQLEEIDQLTAESERAREEISDLRVLVGIAEESRSYVKDLRAQVLAKKAEASPYTAELTAFSKRLEAAAAEVKRLTMILDDLRLQFSNVSFWGSRFGFSKLRNLLLEERVNLMSQLFSQYVKIISDGSIAGRWELTKRGDVECVLHDSIQNCAKNFLGFSRGQQSKIRFTQALVINLMCAPQIGHINIDELLDEGIDATGRSRILSVVRRLPQLKKVIFLTCHDSSVRTFADARLLIERTDNRATAQLEFLRK